MRLIITLSPILIIFGLLSLYGISASGLILNTNSSANYSGENPVKYYDPDSTSIQGPIASTQVDIVKSFKNSSGFYKIDGILENQDSLILTDIQVTKYYKIPSVNDTTLVCYEQSIVNCQYKSIDNQFPSKSLFLSMPPPLPLTGTSFNSDR